MIYSIEKRFLLQYPMPRYFFVPDAGEGEYMAERIEDGLQRLQLAESGVVTGDTARRQILVG